MTESGMRAIGPVSITRNQRFRLGSVLGEGASGIVYRAHDADLGMDVALKALRSLDSTHFSLLKAEFRALAGITHANLVELHELFVDGPECYFTMELINGQAFVDALRRPTADRVERIRKAARQLALGIAAIHDAGKLHRDIKPSNALVTVDDRVVVLDFGVSTSYRVRGVEPEGGPVGTAVYMAPEQGRGSAPSPTADWYSVGVMLFEALTGRPPFEGSFYDVLERKRTTAPPSPRTLDASIPSDLDDLVLRLLAREPGERASVADVLAIVDERGGRAAAVEIAPFVGRTEELGRLTDARAQATAEGRPIVCCVTGQSGIGKTETVRRFVADLRRDPRGLVLEGRCHPLESVPYKALDAVVDGLSRHLKTLSKHRLDSMRVDGWKELVTMFPSLGRAFGTTARPWELETGLQEQRARGFAALGELIAHVAEQRELTVWIDDFQWGDVDSVLGLRQLLTSSGETPVLLVASFRVQEPPISRALQAAQTLFDAQPRDRVHAIHLHPLDPNASRRLVEALCGTQGVPSSQVVDAIAEESAGIPFFVDAMVRRRAESDGVVGARVELAQVVVDGLSRLTDRERRLVEMIAIAGGPIERDVVIEASQSGGAGKIDLMRLGNGHLVRRTELRDRTAVEMIHDRVREVVLAELPAERKRETHRSLAETLRKDGSIDPEVLVQHYQQAGEDDRTSEFARLAADRAAAALAFERAAELYRLARDLRPDLELYGRLAEALANAGRGVDAARAFGEAADVVATQAPSDARALEYRRREAEHYLRSGRLSEGKRSLERVAATVGFTIPGSSRRGMLQAVMRRARLLLRGSTFEAHARPTDPERLDRIDALWGSSTSLSMLDYMVADALGVQHLLEALDAGEPSRIIRGLGYEAAFEAILGGPFFWRRCTRIVATMERLAAGTSRPYDLAWARMSKGITAWFHGRWDIALASCDEAAVLYRQNCKGIAWEIAITDAYGLPTLAYLGRLRELARRVPLALQTADARGDLFAANTCRLGQQNLVYLCANRPADGLRAAQEGVAPFPRDRYLTPHYHYLLAATQAHLYAGDPATAWRLVEEDWPRLRTSQLLRAQFVRIELRHLRARAALALAAETTFSEPTRSRDLLRVAEREAAAIHSDALPVAASFADALQGGIRRVKGDEDGAARHLRAASEGFARHGMKLMAQAAFYQSGGLEGGVHARADRDAAASWMASEGVLSPAAMAAMLVPV